MTRRVLIAICLVLGTACRSSSDGSSGPEPAARGGVVSAATPEAAAAGVRILEAGGNAVDAAVAVSLALGVSEPAGSGIGGQVYVLVHPAIGGPFVINGSTRAPALTPSDAEREDLVGRRASTVPSALKVLDLAWRKYGSGRMAWADLVAPAAGYAEDGFVLGPFRHRSVVRYVRALRTDPATAATLLAPDGSAPPEGTRVRRPRLARTLRRLAEAGAGDFYTGALADAVDRDMRARGGWLRKEDLAGFPEPEVTPPLAGTYRGHDVYTLPPPAGGWVVIQALNVLEHAAPGDLVRDDRRTVWMAEALRVAHGNRHDRPVADPSRPGQDVLRRIGKDRARRIVEGIPPPGSGETTHFCVADGEGTVVAVTQSINAYFGAKVTHPELGFLYNDYMREFETGDPGHPYALRAGRLPYSSMSATILARKGRAVLAVGSPGSRRIISAVVQVTSSWLDSGLPIDDAVAAPRIHVVPEDDDLMLERRPGDRRLLLELERRGFGVAVPLSSLHREGANPYFGGVHALARRAAGGWRGGADPRRDGAVRRAKGR